MQRFRWVFVVMGLLVTLGFSTVQAETATSMNVREDTGRHHYWVHFSDRGQWESLTSQEEVLAAAKEHGLTEAALERRRLEGLAGEQLVTLADLPPDPLYVEQVAACGAEVRQVSRWFNLVSVSAPASALAEIRALPFVEAVQPVGVMENAFSEYEVVTTFDGNPPPTSGILGPGGYGPSYLQALQVNAVEAHRRGITGHGLLMAVIDGGFELSHECFERLDVVADWDVVENDDYSGQEPDDPDWQAAHGTGCLSEIAGYSPGNLIGIAYEASFLLAKTEDVSSETPLEEDNYVAALEWCERLGARVTSTSLGYTDWYNVADYDGATAVNSRANNRALELGVVCVNSAGNAGPQPRTLGAPADGWGTLTIGAVDSLGIIGRFSSRGPTADGRTKPDLVARGVRTVLSAPYTRSQYSLWNGTSMSTPVAAGVAALVRAARPEWSAKETIQALKSTADRADHPDNVYGWGLPDVMAAIRYPEVRIQLRTEDGIPLEGVEAQLTRAGQPNLHLRQTSDEQGVLSFANLDAGEWAYEVKLPRIYTVIEGRPVGELTVPEGRELEIVIATGDMKP